MTSEMAKTQTSEISGYFKKRDYSEFSNVSSKDSLDGYDWLLLLREDDPAVEEGRDDVLHDEVHLGLADLVKVLVEVGPGDCAGAEHAVLLPHLVVLVALRLLGRQPLDLLGLGRLLLLARVLGRHVGERVVRLVVTLVQTVPLPGRKDTILER